MTQLLGPLLSELRLRPDTLLTPEDVEAIALGRLRLGLDDEGRRAIDACSRTLDEARARKEIIYGLTTGFGPLAGQLIEGEDIELLQKNLVYHLASGTGAPLERPWVRAMIVCRAACLARGYSAVHASTVDLLLSWLNEDITPFVPRYGTVGASGDLTPLAHLALAMMGEGEVLVDGQRVPAQPELIRHKLAPLRLRDRDGLAIVNGTAAMTGLAALAHTRGKRVLERALDLGALYAECMGAFGDAYDPFFARLRPHPGQERITFGLQERLMGSVRLSKKPGDVQKMFKILGAGAGLPQDAYTLRCIPQLLGAVEDMLSHHGTVVTRELNSVTDNPLFDPMTGRVYHGGNFFGQHIALVSDAFNQSMTLIAVLAERQIARITDPTLSPFPAFLQPHRGGLQSGLMGAQVTASSLIAYLRGLGTPLSTQSMPTNANNQDVNPMGTLAALRSHEILDRLVEVLSILAICLLQAHELEIERTNNEAGFSPRAQALASELKQIVPPLIVDRPLSRDIESMARFLEQAG